MKKVLIAVFYVLIINICNGQDSLEFKPHVSTSFGADVIIGSDTIKVILLVGDTSKWSGYGQPYFVYGYSVRMKYCCINGNTSNLAYYQPIPYYSHLLYLDDKRQPLKSTVIVWQSTQIKPTPCKTLK